MITVSSTIVIALRQVDLPCRGIEVDEIWTFVRKKQYRLRPDELSDPDADRHQVADLRGGGTADPARCSDPDVIL